MITTETKALPKSLHTVTAIVRVAETMMEVDNHTSSRRAIESALSILGYAGAPDPHGLAAKALKALEA